MKTKLAVLVLCGMLGVGGELRAASLLLHYDVENPLSWSGGQLHDLQGFGASLTPSAGTGGVGYAAPFYVSSGAQVNHPLARTRPYLYFDNFGKLTGSGKSQDIFNDLSAPVGDQARGYTMEGIFLIESTLAAKSNSGIGFNQGTSGENQFIARVGAGYSSNSAYDTSANGSQLRSLNSSINSTSIIPRDEWFHFIKVHDPDPDGNGVTDGGEIRYYLNGALVQTVPFDTAGDTDNIAGNATQYWMRGENYGAVGDNGREIENLGYSMTRFYRGAMTQAEVSQAFRNAVFVPEPSAGALLLLGLVGGVGAVGLRRRRRGADMRVSHSQ